MIEAHIRTVRIADLPQVRDLLVETWHATYDNIYGAKRVTEITDDWHSLENLTVQMRGSGTVFLVTETPIGIEATSLARRKNDGNVDHGIVMLDRLYVRPRSHGLGLGAALLQATLGRFESLTLARLEVEPQNVPAIAFYARHGFVTVGDTADCGGASSIVARVMERKQEPGPLSR